MLTLACLAVALAAAASGCTNSGKGKTAGGTAGARGGTLNVLMTSDFAHLDPARNGTASAQDFGRLIYRTLTTYRSLQGSGGGQLVGDLAKSWSASDDARTWTFTLKPGLKYQDGTPISSKDIKYGVERAFDPALFGGPRQIQQWLADVPAGYRGPKGSGGRELSSITTPNVRTITFRLSRAVGDFPYAAAEPTTAPVRRPRDTGLYYDTQVLSSGPYQIQSYQRGKSLVLVRNRYWSQSTDQVRHAYPDRVVCTFGLDPVTIDQRLIADSGEDRTAITLARTVEPGNLAQVRNNQTVTRRSLSGRTGSLRFLAINTTTVPNLKVRQAIEYAVDKQAYRAARGGAAAGDYASTILAPSLQGYRSYDLFRSARTGDPAKAKALLREAGVRVPTLRLATSDDVVGRAQAAAVRNALARAGLQVRIVRYSPTADPARTANPASAPDLAFATLTPDWPTGSAVIPSLFGGRQAGSPGYVFLSSVADPTLQSDIDVALIQTDPAKAADHWATLDQKIMQRAPIVPLLYDKLVTLHGSKVKGSFLHVQYGEPDLVSLSVA